MSGSLAVTMRRLLTSLVAVALVALWAPGSNGVVSADSEAERAAKEIADARERANKLADLYFASLSKVDTLNDEVAALERDVAEIQAKIDDLQRAVDNMAINRFTRSGTQPVPILTGFSGIEDQSQMDVFLDVLDDANAEDFDVYESLQLDLRDKQGELDDKVAEAQAESANLEQLKQQANAEVERLKEIEEDRLKDEAVRKALEAEQAARARRAAQQAALSSDTVPVDTTPTDANGGDGADDIDSGGFVPPSTTLPPQGGTAGQTGGGGTGGLPGVGDQRDYGGEGWVCPIGTAPGVFFADTWGAPRSGGRRHQGVDMIGPRGTEILAVVDGVATPRTNTLGGTTVNFRGADGNEYYYAHLDGYGQLGAVPKGTVIGYMGDTGNAKFSVVHLHFEIHPGGGTPVNPYPTVRKHCG
jgi:murein DD-endopeptidase MepM/ murein hydrolase activator NlpD